VSFRAFVDRDYREYRIGAVKKKVGANWVKIDPRKLLNVRPGQLLRLRLTLNSLAGDASKTVDLSVRIPAGTAGNRGSLRILGGAWVFGGPGASSFDDLLTKMENAPHNNDVLRTLRIGRPGPDTVSKQTTKFSDVVAGFAQFRLRVVK
jgi:hypothetical protein